MEQYFYLQITVKDEKGQEIDLKQKVKLLSELDKDSCMLINRIGAVLKQYTRRKEILEAKKQKFMYAKFWIS